MARKKGDKDIAPMIRGAFIRAVKQLENGGRPLSDIIRRELEKRPLETLQAMAKFMPREHKVQASVEHTHTHTVTKQLSDTIKFLEQFTREEGTVIPGEVEGKRLPPEKSLPN